VLGFRNRSGLNGYGSPTLLGFRRYGVRLA